MSVTERRKHRDHLRFPLHPFVCTFLILGIRSESNRFLIATSTSESPSSSSICCFFRCPCCRRRGGLTIMSLSRPECTTPHPLSDPSTKHRDTGPAPSTLAGPARQERATDRTRAAALRASKGQEENEESFQSDPSLLLSPPLYGPWRDGGHILERMGEGTGMGSG